MVNTTVVGSIGAYVSIFLGLPVQDSQVDVPICEEHRTIRAAPDLFQPKGLFVKSSGSVGVLGGQGNVLDLRHDRVLLCSVLGLLAKTPPQRRSSRVILGGIGACVNDKCRRCRRWLCSRESICENVEAS